MKQEPKKKQWKYNPIVKDLHSNKYHQRIKPSRPKDKDAFDIEEELEDYYKDKEGETKWLSKF